MTNLNALIAEVGTVSRAPGGDRAAVLHVLHRVDNGWLTAGEGREALEALGLVSTPTHQPPPVRPSRTAG
jgi:hypothetical protein